MKEVRELFSKAALQHEAAKGLNSDDWAGYQKIQAEHEQRQRFEMRQYELDYDTRVETARKKLIDEAGKVTRGFVPKFLGRDGFDKSAIERQAHRIVHQEHRAMLARMEVGRNDQIDALLATAQDRQNPRPALKRDFAQASDRRLSPDRRRGPSR